MNFVSRWRARHAERGFCKHCGSFILWREVDSLHTSISAGCLDSPTGLELTSHIYVQDKGDYYKLDDGLPTFGQSD
ncbi:MAG: GFA family protein [Granulosicoccus sp.]